MSIDPPEIQIVNRTDASNESNAHKVFEMKITHKI